MTTETPLESFLDLRETLSQIVPVNEIKAELDGIENVLRFFELFRIKFEAYRQGGFKAKVDLFNFVQNFNLDPRTVTLAAAMHKDDTEVNLVAFLINIGFKYELDTKGRVQFTGHGGMWKRDTVFEVLPCIVAHLSKNAVFNNFENFKKTEDQEGYKDWNAAIDFIQTTLFMKKVLVERK